MESVIYAGVDDILGKHNFNRTIRLFVSSTFKDMMEERDILMSHVWPELRLFCRERHVDLVEVDLRWGIAEEQSTRRETLKICLDEIRACRPFFIGLLGERYGWVPEEDAFTEDLKEEQPWLKELTGKSITELEILHGVLNNPEMADRAFFYFRDPKYVETISIERKADFLSEDPSSTEKQFALKNVIRDTCVLKNIPLYETYPDPKTLAQIILDQLKDTIEKQFPKESISDPLTREANDHEAFAEIRRRTYIGRPDYFERLDRHCTGNEVPILLLGDSGIGKSALISNWVEHWRQNHPKDFIFQHYIGSTPDSSVHWKIMTRLMEEIKRWSGDNDELPKTKNDILRDFALWLAKARIKADRDGVKFIVVLDALNQLEETDHGNLLGWLPSEPFTGNLRLIVSALPGKTLDALKNRSLTTLQIQPLKTNERERMIVEYLKRFGKSLDRQRIEPLSNSEATANPLYLKILLDELRITGTHDRLDERLKNYLSARDIAELLEKVLNRYKFDYEHDRKGLVSEILGLIWSARRGLTENELLKILRPANLPQLPLAIWAPLKAALEENLVNRDGILNFAHDFLNNAVENAFAADSEKKNALRLLLANYFEAEPVTARSCDELPWLLDKTKSYTRLRNCLLNIDNFLEIYQRDEEELRGYWVTLKEERTMGKAYLDSFNNWKNNPELKNESISYTSNVGEFLYRSALYSEAEIFYRLSLKIDEKSPGSNYPNLVNSLSNLASLLHATNRLSEAEQLIRRSIMINEKNLGKDHKEVATGLNDLAYLLKDTNRLNEAEPHYRKALKIYEENLGQNHPYVAICLNNLSMLLKDTNRLSEAEQLMRRALKIDEKNFGENHSTVSKNLNNLAIILQETNRLSAAESLYRRALKIDEESFGKDHPNVAADRNNLAELLKATNRQNEAEPYYRRALKIFEESLGENHPIVATVLNNIAQLLQATNRLSEAEMFFRRALKIDEESFGKDHRNVSRDLNNLALLLKDTTCLGEAEQLLRRALQIDKVNFGEDHPKIATVLNNLALLLQDNNHYSEAELLFRRALKINEANFGENPTNVAIDLHNLSSLLRKINRLSEAEPMSHRAIEILIKFARTTGYQHPSLKVAVDNYTYILKSLGWSEEKILSRIKDIAPESL